jgi:multicomponent Na+:H+ antiporter subunit E
VTVPARAILFLLLWVVLAGTDPIDLAVGAGAAVAAGWLSARIWPPAGRPPHPLRVLVFVAGLFGQSIRSGIDVSRRALDPRARLNPGLVAVPLALPAGDARAVFLTLMAVVPGTIPSGTEADGTVVVHCLDVADPVAADFAGAEARFARALAHGGRHG